MFKRFTPIIVLTAICWLVFVVNNLALGGRFDACGIVPRHVSSLLGIIWAPFLHGSFRHIAANTLPLLVLGGIICARSRGEFAIVTLAGIVLGGAVTWLVARPACHIGASGLIFSYFGYLASLALFRRTFGALCLSVICLIGYGGMIWGIMPTSATISWEGHAAGLLAGVFIGWFAAKLDKTPTEPANQPAGLARVP